MTMINDDLHLRFFLFNFCGIFPSNSSNKGLRGKKTDTNSLIIGKESLNSIPIFIYFCFFYSLLWEEKELNLQFKYRRVKIPPISNTICYFNGNGVKKTSENSYENEENCHENVHHGFFMRFYRN